MVGRRRRLLLAGLAVAGLVVGAAPVAAGTPPPSNDAFSNATVIGPGALPYVDEQDTTTATHEDDEPDTDCNSGYSIWYRITPTATAYLRADTLGSGGAQVSVLKGTSLLTLDEIGCSQNATGVTIDGRLTWRASAGVRYYIRVGGAREDAVLHVRKVAPPANDDFADARNVASLPFVDLTDLVNSTRQAGEPGPSCTKSGRTIWYRYRPASTTYVQVDTFLSGIDTWIVVYRGTSLPGLVPLACGDETSQVGDGGQSSVTWKAIAGKTYFVQVGGYANMADELGVRLRKVTPPPNDDLLNAQVLPQTGALRQGSTRTATLQAGEPFDPDCPYDQGGTIWYRFTATDTAGYDVDATGSEIDAVVSVFTGATLGSLVPVECDNGDSVTFGATDGTLYWIQVAGYAGDSGAVHITLRQNP